MGEIENFWSAVEHRRITLKHLPLDVPPARSAQDKRDRMLAMLPTVDALTAKLAKAQTHTELMLVDSNGNGKPRRIRTSAGWVATRCFVEAPKLYDTKPRTHQQIVFLALRSRQGPGLYLAHCLDPLMNGKSNGRDNGKVRTYGDVGLGGAWPERLDLVDDSPLRANPIRIGKYTSPASFEGIEPHEVWRGLVEIAVLSFNRPK